VIFRIPATPVQHHCYFKTVRRQTHLRLGRVDRKRRRALEW